jgi:hypothetical protein
VPGLVVIAVLLGAAFTRRGVPRLAAVMVVFYLALLVVLRSLWTFNTIGERYLLPALPLVWLACGAALVAAAERVRYVGRAAAVLGALVGLASIGTLQARLASPEQRAERLARTTALDELRRLVPPGDAALLSDAGHLIRSATGRSAVQVPSLPFSLRPFDSPDLERWEKAGVREGVFRRGRDESFEDRDALAERLGGILADGLEGGWTVLDSTEHFVRVRLAP